MVNFHLSPSSRGGFWVIGRRLGGFSCIRTLRVWQLSRWHFPFVETFSNTVKVTETFRKLFGFDPCINISEHVRVSHRLMTYVYLLVKQLPYYKIYHHNWHWHHFLKCYLWHEGAGKELVSSFCPCKIIDNAWNTGTEQYLNTCFIAAVCVTLALRPLLWSPPAWVHEDKIKINYRSLKFAVMWLFFHWESCNNRLMPFFSLGQAFDVFMK